MFSKFPELGALLSPLVGSLGAHPEAQVTRRRGGTTPEGLLVVLTEVRDYQAVQSGMVQVRAVHFPTPRCVSTLDIEAGGASVGHVDRFDRNAA